MKPRLLALTLMICWLTGLSAGPVAAEEPTVPPQLWRVPLSFEANAGQENEAVFYTSRGVGYEMYFTTTGPVISLPIDETTGHAIQMVFVGGNPVPEISAEGEQPGHTNYFIGNDPDHWRTDVALYDQVRYHDIYPGIDVVFYGNQTTLEYDFVVAPGVDPSVIEVQFEGADGLTIADNGDLLLAVSGKELVQKAPYTFQEVADERVTVDSAFALEDDRLHVDLGDYDASRPLLIDPELVYSTYLGGGNTEWSHDIAIDSSGNAYVSGETKSIDFPTTTGAYRTSLGGSYDVFVSKLTADGSGLVYSTYLGGVSSDYGRSIAVDSSGNVYVSGETQSADFPTTAGAYQTAGGGGYDAFVAKLTPDGSGLVYSTYLGGGGAEFGDSLAVDNSGHAYATGRTTSINFPTTAGAYQTTNMGSDDVFVTKLTADGSGLIYSTYLGGGAYDKGHDIAIDSSGNAYVTGEVYSDDFPTTAGAYQTSRGGSYDAFVTRLTADGSDLVYSTYLGGGSSDYGRSIAIDGSDNAYVGGHTGSSNFPTTTEAYQTTGGGSDDVFVTKLTADGSELLYSTYLGGGSSDYGRSIAIDGSGNAYVGGYTGSNNFPTTADAYQTTGGGGSEAFITSLTADGSGLIYSTYLGGGSNDDAYIAIDSRGNAYVGGSSGSIDFPTTAGVYQTASGGGNDAFVAKFSFQSLPTNPDSVTETSGTADNAWQNNVSDPAFIWSGATDGDGSGIKAYGVYWGTASDGTDTVTTTLAAYDPAAVSDGTYYLRLNTVNNSDAEAGWETAFTFKYDGTAPANPTTLTETTHSTVDGGWGNYTNPAFEWDPGSDTTAGVKEYGVYWGTDSAGSTATATTAGTTYTPAALSSDDTYYLRLNTADNAGNSAGWETVFTYNHETVAPTAPTVFTETGGVTSGVMTGVSAPAFTWSGATDADSGLAGYDVYWGTSSVGTTVVSTTTSAAYTPAELSAGGTYYLRLRARDQAGNTSAWTDGFTYVYDNTAPTNPDTIIEMGGAIDNTWQDMVNAPAFTWSGATDGGNGSGVQDYDVYWGTNASGTTVVDTVSAAAYTPTALLINSEGVYYLRLRTRNGTGAASAWITAFTFKYDLKGPVTPSSASETNGAISGAWQDSINTPTFTWSEATDGGVGVASYDVYWGTSSSGVTVVATTTNASYSPAVLTGDGSYYLRLRAKDTLGNSSNWATVFNFKYDDASPTAPTFAAENGGVISGTWQSAVTAPSFTWSGASDGAGSGIKEYDVYWGLDASGATVTHRTATAAYAPGLATNGTYYRRSEKEFGTEQRNSDNFEKVKNRLNFNTPTAKSLKR